MYTLHYVSTESGEHKASYHPLQTVAGNLAACLLNWPLTLAEHYSIIKATQHMAYWPQSSDTEIPVYAYGQGNCGRSKIGKLYVRRS